MINHIARHILSYAVRPIATLREARGSMLIETAIFLPFLVLVFFGLVELSQYLDVKERVNRMANQAADVFGSIQPTSETIAQIQADWGTMQAIFTQMSAPHNINVSVAMCSSAPIFTNGGAVPIYSTSIPTLQTTNNGRCGFKDSNDAHGSSAPAPALVCPLPAAFAPGALTVAIVQAQCLYVPMFNYFGLFPGGQAIVSSNVLTVPLRGGGGSFSQNSNAFLINDVVCRKAKIQPFCNILGRL